MEKVWTQQNGTQIKISEMTDTHIHNAIKMMERNECTDVEVYRGLKNELVSRIHGLRPVKAEIRQRVLEANDDHPYHELKTFHGWFHCWTLDKDEDSSCTYGLVENAEGKIFYVSPDKIQFTDRKVGCTFDE